MKSDSRSILSFVPELLTWDTSSPVVPDAHEHLVGQLESALARARRAIGSVDPTLADAVSRELEDLEPAGRRRILTSPAACSRLLWAPQRPLEAARFLRSAALAEALRGEHRPCADRNVWSALGDVHFTAGSLPALGVRHPTERAGSRATVYRAPVIGGGIPVDWWSPRARSTYLGRGVAPPSPWPELDVPTGLAVAHRLDEALVVIGQTSATAAELVLTFTKVVVVRAAPWDPESFGGASGLAEIGQTLLLNPHLPTVTTEDLAEALLHEALHAILYVSELVQPWIEPTTGIEVISPWTGRPLSVRGYLHACIVWAALWSFWRRAEERQALGLEGGAAARRRRAANGFGAGPMLGAVAPNSAKVVPEVCSVIDAVEALVTESARGV